MRWFLSFVRSFLVHLECHYPGLKDSVCSFSYTFFPKLTMPLRVAIVLLCPKLLMTYSSMKFFALLALLIRSSFLLARSAGKQRLILDLRHVNGFIYKQKFKCENLSVATQIFDKDYYLFKFDLKAGYHFIEVFPKHHKYCLAFTWDFGSGKFRFFQFCVLPFGLPSTLFIFTKILKPFQSFSLTFSF